MKRKREILFNFWICRKNTKTHEIAFFLTRERKKEKKVKMYVLNNAEGVLGFRVAKNNDKLGNWGQEMGQSRPGTNLIVLEISNFGKWKNLI